MSLLMVSEAHLRKSLAGEKTQTRRLWESARLKSGNSYRLVRSDVAGAMFTPREDAPAYIVVNDVWQEPLGTLTPEEAQAEGGYTVEEFQSIWQEMHDEWNPEELVYVVDYETFEDDPRE